MVISEDRLIYVGLAALVALAIWFFIKTGYSPPTEEKPYRPSNTDPQTAELLRARKTVQRQIEVQESIRRGRGDFSDEGLSQLKAILEEIEAELQERTTFQK